jgi:hypothetical protein
MHQQLREPLIITESLSIACKTVTNSRQICLPRVRRIPVTDHLIHPPRVAHLQQVCSLQTDSAMELYRRHDARVSLSRISHLSPQLLIKIMMPSLNTLCHFSAFI